MPLNRRTAHRVPVYGSRLAPDKVTHAHQDAVALSWEKESFKKPPAANITDDPSTWPPLVHRPDPAQAIMDRYREISVDGEKQKRRLSYRETGQGIRGAGTR